MKKLIQTVAFVTMIPLSSVAFAQATSTTSGEAQEVAAQTTVSAQQNAAPQYSERREFIATSYSPPIYVAR